MVVVSTVKFLKHLRHLDMRTYSKSEDEGI
jgi:hypothetical protein